MIKHAVLVLAIFASSISTAQEISNAPTTEASSTVVVPANTEVVLRLNDDLSTKGGQIKVGHMFNLTVAYDVKVRGVVAIPSGAVAKGEVTMRTGKGVFGKSGKMQIEMRSVDLDNQRIPLTGKYQQEGEGNTLAAVGAIGRHAKFSRRARRGKRSRPFAVDDQRDVRGFDETFALETGG